MALGEVFRQRLRFDSAGYCDIAEPAPDVQQPRIKKIVPEDGGMAIYVENLKGYMRVKSGKDLSLSDGVTPAVQTGGSDDTVKIVVPKEGDSGFYKVIRN